MVDGLGGLFTAAKAAMSYKGKGKGGGQWRDTRVPEEQEPQAGAAGGAPAGGGGGSGPGGYYEETIFGGKTWHSTNGSGDLHGQEAVDKADKVFGGPPTDGITGEPGYYGSWEPSSGGGGGQYQRPSGGVAGWGR